MDFPSLVGIGIAVFAATNIDDIFILIMFFSALTFPPRQVVFGQYLGIAALTAAGAVGSLIALVVPEYIVGLMGLAPIAIGITKLLDLRKKDDVPKEALKDKKSSVAVLTVAGVTIANGGDNIGVYTPLFAKYNASVEVATIAATFMGMTAVWCATAYYLVNHPLVATRIRRVGHIVLPFVLIGLGIYILAEAFLF